MVLAGEEAAVEGLAAGDAVLLVVEAFPQLVSAIKPAIATVKDKDRKEGIIEEF